MSIFSNSVMEKEVILITKNTNLQVRKEEDMIELFQLSILAKNNNSWNSKNKLKNLESFVTIQGFLLDSAELNHHVTAVLNHFFMKSNKWELF